MRVLVSKKGNLFETVLLKIVLELCLEKGLEIILRSSQTSQDLLWVKEQRSHLLNFLSLFNGRNAGFSPIELFYPTRKYKRIFLHLFIPVGAKFQFTNEEA